MCIRDSPMTALHPNMQVYTHLPVVIVVGIKTKLIFITIIEHGT
jgi:hypothetical protein